MKKLLGISLVAVLTTVPLMAMAEGELTAPKTIASDVEETGAALTQQSYVKGAYNAALGEIRKVNNAVSVLNGNVSTTGSVLKAVKDTGANATYSESTTYAENTIGAAIKNAISVSGTSAGAGLTKNVQTGEFSVNVDGTTIEISSDSLQVKGGSIGATQLATAVNTSLGKADSALQASDVTTGSTGGAITVKGTAVPVATDTTHQFVTDTEKATWNAKQNQLTNGTNNINATVKTAIATGEENDLASDTALLTESAVYDAIEAAKTAATTANSDLADRVTANENAITAIDGTEIPVASGWGGAGGTDTTGTITISSLRGE